MVGVVITNRGAKVRMVAVAPNMRQMMMRRPIMPMRFLEKKRSRSQLYIYQKQRQSKLLQIHKGESVPSPKPLYLLPQEQQEHRHLDLTRLTRPHLMTTYHLAKLPRKVTHLRPIQRSNILKTWQTPRVKLITLLH